MRILIYALFWFKLLVSARLETKVYVDRGAILERDISYGRRIIQMPREHVISQETITDRELQRELRNAEELFFVKNFTEDVQQLVILSAALISESRNAQTPFMDWMEHVSQEKPCLVFTLTEKQREVLAGTTVENAYEDMQATVSAVYQSLGNFTAFRRRPITMEDIIWSVSVVLKHGKLVHPHQDLRDRIRPRMYLLPLLPLLDAPMDPDPEKSIAFQEEVVLQDGKEEEAVLLIARRDMLKGETVFMWPGRLSDSELLLRHNITFKRNPIGIGNNASIPENWSDDVKSSAYKEYEKFNCTEAEHFEFRISKKGFPNRQFVRCYRVAWFIQQGWYNPGYARPEMVAMLDKWPPPKRYTHDDWLPWTQADNAFNKVLQDYCNQMKETLREAVDDDVKDYFRASADPNDRVIWKLRQTEKKTWRECLALVNYVR